MTIKMGLAAMAALSVASTAVAQADAVHRTTLQEQAFPSPAYHTLTMRTVIDPKGLVASHTHPGAEMAYVLAGQGALIVKGAAPKSLAVGDSFSIPQGTVHSVRNTGAAPLTLLSTYVVERAKPIATMEP